MGLSHLSRDLHISSIVPSIWFTNVDGREAGRPLRVNRWDRQQSSERI